MHESLVGTFRKWHDVRLKFCCVSKSGHCRFALSRDPAAPARFDVDPKLASEAMKVARLNAGREEITGRLSWDCLVRLASPTLPAAARQALEARVIAVEKIVASDIARARHAHASRSDQTATRMAA